jgi:hypothetical protein
MLQKMMQDYRLQRYQVASSQSFRELIAETEIHVFGISKKSKGARMASLEQLADDE